jgi:hypothetical protein
MLAGPGDADNRFSRMNKYSHLHRLSSLFIIEEARQDGSGRKRSDWLRRLDIPVGLNIYSMPDFWRFGRRGIDQ